MRKIKADFVYPVSSPSIKDGVVILNDDNSIQDVVAYQEKLGEVEEYQGIICPGFVNTHCHLELSHMKSLVNEGKGLVEFIKELQSQRESDPDFVQECIQKAEAEMIENGIIAVGDISNGPDTFNQKSKRNIHYHTFIELYGFVNEQAEESFHNGIKLIDEYWSKLGNYSLVPHSPYAASTDLWKLICDWAKNNQGILSIHNEETEDENRLFLEGKGSLIELMQWFGLDTSFWKPTGKTSLQSVQDLIPSEVKTLLVHNTFTNPEEILTLKSKVSNLFWCLCPNANWYIEKRLPNIPQFIEADAKVTLGTDSLSSNWSLSILSEMQRIKELYPGITTSKLVEWGTKNGAELLGIEDQFGSLEKGKRPGINLITNNAGNEITADSRVKKLA